MNSSPSSSSQNFVGNQVTNESSLLLGLYALQGTDHFEYGNTVKGQVVPAQTQEPSEQSLFDYDFDSFYENVGSIPPFSILSYDIVEPAIEADHRFHSMSQRAICEDNVYLPTSTKFEKGTSNTIEAFPNPFSSEVNIWLSDEGHPLDIFLFDLTGQVVISISDASFPLTIPTLSLAPGLYILQIGDQKMKVVKI
jgi:hypothetical protein